MRGRQRTKREIEQRQSGSSSSTWSQHRWRGDAIWRRARIIDMGGGGFGRQRGGLLLQCCFSFVTTRRHMEVESMAGKTVVRWIWPTAMADPAGHRYSWPHGRVERTSWLGFLYGLVLSYNTYLTCLVQPIRPTLGPNLHTCSTPNQGQRTSLPSISTSSWCILLRLRLPSSLSLPLPLLVGRPSSPRTAPPLTVYSHLGELDA